MISSASLQEDYRRCVERDFRRGHAGVCADPSLKEVFWHSLLADPDLHHDLQGEDPLAAIAAALRGHLDLAEALRSLSRAFEVLELAAINLYFFPWRKEFATIKTFSGVYVHVLRGVLPEADLAKSFRRLGYVQQDNLHLFLSKLPPGASLLGAACGFFAARVECEILGKLAQELRPCLVSPDQLLQARRDSDGTLEGCVAKLQRLARWPRGQEAGGGSEPTDEMDLYREGPGPYGEAWGAGLPMQEAFSPPEGAGGGSSPRLRSGEFPLCSQPLLECQGRWWPPSPPEQPYSNGFPIYEGPDLPTSFSFRSLRRELSRTTDTDYAAQPGARFLSPAVAYDSPPGLQLPGANPPGSPTAWPPRSPQLSSAGARRAQGFGPSPAAAATPEPPCYHLHSCLRPGALPCCCCNTCRLLHGAGCEGAQACRAGAHRVEELQSERQKRLWLQRTEVDQLLQEGGGAWQ